MGEFHPEAHVNGISGCSFMALILRSFSAKRLSSDFIVLLYLCFFGTFPHTKLRKHSQQCNFFYSFALIKKNVTSTTHTDMKHLIRIIAITVLAALLSTSTAEAQRHNGTDKREKTEHSRQHDTPRAQQPPHKRGTGIIIPPPGQHLT